MVFQPAANTYNIILLQSEKLHADVSLYRNMTNSKAYEPEIRENIILTEHLIENNNKFYIKC